MHIHGSKQTPPTPPTTSDEDSSGSTDDAEMKKKKGNRAMGKKKYPKAIKYYSKAVKIDPRNPTYRLNRAIASSALELWKDAEADAALAVKLGDPPSSKSHYQLARARLRRGQCEEAREALAAGLEAHPGEAALLQLSKEVDRVFAAREARRKKEAEIEQVSEAARKEAVRLSCVRGKAAMREKRWPDAAEAFQSAVDMQEAMPPAQQDKEAMSNAYNNLGIACKSCGRMAAAVEALNKSYVIATKGDDQVATPQASQILQNLAQCLLQQDKTEEARHMYTRALQIGQRLFGADHAAHALNYMGIARCLKRESKVPEALKSYTTAYELLTSREPEVCLKEMPELPNKERLAQVIEQCRQELAQLVLLLEELKDWKPPPLEEKAEVQAASEGEEPGGPKEAPVEAAAEESPALARVEKTHLAVFLSPRAG